MELNKIIECINNGGVALLPTDTVYGLLAKPDIKSAVDKIYALKNRPQKMYLPLMAANISQLENLGLDLNDSALKLLNSKYVPGALTLILGIKTNFTNNWLKGRQEIAVRIPNENQLLKVLLECGPLLATSANKHGSLNTSNKIDTILEELNGKPDLVVDSGVLNEIPSTIINCRKTRPVIERAGGISEQELFKILDNE